MEPRFRLSYRIAVHLGEAVVGLVGTQDRLDYTIIGDTVNTAKRLQENGMAGKVFLSDKFYERVKDCCPRQSRSNRCRSRAAFSLSPSSSCSISPARRCSGNVCRLSPRPVGGGGLTG